MTLRTIIVLSLTALPLTMTACSGKSNGTVVREEAHNRMDLVHAQMAFDQAQQTFATGQFDKAMRQVETAIARSPERAPYHLLQGRIYLETNRLESAKKCFDHAIELDSQMAEPYYFTGIIYQRWSEHERAAESYMNAYERKTDNVAYLVAAGESLISTGDYAAAQRLVEPKMAHFEHNAALRQLLAQIAQLQGDPARAASLYEEARLLNPDDNILLEEAARAHFASGSYTKAHHAIRRLQELDSSERIDLLHLEARCLAMMERHSEARNLYLKLTQLSPADVSVWVELGNTALAVGDFRRVALCSSRVVALAPERFEGYLFKGLYEQEQGNQDASTAAFAEAASRADDAAWPHILLGMSLEESGRVDQARLAYGRALRIQPSNQLALRRLEQLDSHGLATESAAH